MSASDAPAAPAPTDDRCRPGTLAADLRVGVMRLSRRLRAQRGDAELSDGKFGILATLRHEGPMTPSALAELERVRPPSMTRAVNVLVELGFVEKLAHPSDGRHIVVALTDAGRAEIRETKRRRDAWITRQLSELTKEERQTLARASELLSRIAAQ